jgi:hypothetical protein
MPLPAASLPLYYYKLSDVMIKKFTDINFKNSFPFT